MARPRGTPTRRARGAPDSASVGAGRGGRRSPTAEDASRASRAWSLPRDDRLSARAAKGDRQAFAELYRRHHQRLYRYCLSLVGDPEDAADVLQTTMAKALSALEGGEAVKGVRPWLFRIAHNASIDLIRSRRPRAPLEELEQIGSSALTVPSAATEAQSRAELAEVVTDIRELPDRQASALVMRELSELSYAEIAGALETSQPAARQLVHQARSLLHDNRSGRGMDCEAVRRGLGDTDGKRPRDRRMRAHLAACQSCAAFGYSIRARRSALTAVAPPLSATAAGDILARLLESGSTAGAGAAAGGATAASAGLAKLAGASGIVKTAAAAAGGAAAVAAVGGAVWAGGALLGPDEPSPRASASGSSLQPDLPPLRSMDEWPRANADGERRADSSSPSDGEAGAEAAAGDPPTTSSDDAEPPGPSGPSGDGLPPVALADGDPPLELRVADERERPGARLLRTEGSRVDVPGVEVPGGSDGVEIDVPEVEVPGGSDGVEIDVPGVEVPDGSDGVEVDVPDVEVPPVEVPDAGSIDPNPGSVDVPDAGSVEIPDAGPVDAPDAGSIDVPGAESRP